MKSIAFSSADDALVILFSNSYDLVSEALNFLFVAYDDDLIEVQLREHIAQFV